MAMEDTQTGILRITFEEMFALEQAGEKDRFRSLYTDGRPKRVFGGQLLGQVLVAALETVPAGRPAHALQVQFRQAGLSNQPFDFAVARTSDGRSFSSRQVTVTQDDRLIMLAMASFHQPEDGIAFQYEMPAAPDPGDLRSEQDLRAGFILADGGSEAKARALSHLAFEMRPAIVQNPVRPEKKPPYQQYWCRPFGPTPSGDMKRQAMIAYLSDILFLSTTLHAHGIHWLSTAMNWASLNHTLFIHAEPDFSDWSLWHIDAVWTGGARGAARGSVYRRDGTLVATVMQEGLMRIRD